MCQIKTQYSDHSIQVRVLPPKVLYTSCLLGLDWCNISECLLSPSKNIVSFQTVQGVKFEKLVVSTLQPPPANLENLQRVKTPNQKELTQTLITRGQRNTNVGARPTTLHKWVNVHGTFAEGPRRGEPAVWRVRKGLTAAQGWHKGATRFWVPK